MLAEDSLKKINYCSLSRWQSIFLPILIWMNTNPDWISQIVWNAICDLEKMPNFVGIIGAFVHNSKEWKRWFMSATPESDSLPGEWE